MELWRQMLLSRLHVELGDDESEEDFLLLSLFIDVISKIVKCHHGGSNPKCILDIFGYSTIGYLKINTLSYFLL
jgi:hypothetical protein